MLVVLAVLSPVPSGAAPPSPPGAPGEPWSSTLALDHALVGRIWDVAGARFIDAPTLLARLGAARFVLLGEKHDNPDHHRLQAWVLRGLIAAGRRPAVAFEMLDTDDQAAIDRHLAAAPDDAAGLAKAVDWEHSGWPDWTMYQPIAEAALSARLPVVAANLADASLQELRKGGVAALDPALAGRLGLDRPLTPALRAALAEEIRDAHCGHTPTRMLDQMIDTQRARDAKMADALIGSGIADGGVLITGYGHARKDRGVPLYLSVRLPGASVASVAFLEVEHGVTAPGTYVARPSGETLPVDYVWFTPRLEDGDACEKFRKSLERLKTR